MKKLISLSFLLLILSPRAYSCAVCFGQVDTPMTRALNWGIIFMLGVLLVVFSGVFAFIWQMNEKSRQIQLKTTGTKTC